MSDDKVVPLRGGSVDEPPLNEVLIVKLEELLAQARRNEIMGYALATVSRGQDYFTDYSVEDGGNLQLLGAVQMLNNDLVKSLDDDSDEE